MITAADPDWQHNRFGSDLWIWREKTGNATVPFTRSGGTCAQLAAMVPGRASMLRFLSDLQRWLDDEGGDKDAPPERVWLIAADSEAMSFPLYKEKLDAPMRWHGLRMERRVYFSCTTPLSKDRGRRLTRRSGKM